MTEQYLTPKPEFALADLERAMAGLGAAQVEPGDDDLYSWLLDGAVVRLFVDPALHVEQLLVENDPEGSVAADISAVVPVYGPSDLPALFAGARSDGELEEALAVLAAVAPARSSPELLALFERGFEHSDSLVREAALIAASVPQWPEFRDRAIALAQTDPDASVRETAAALIEAMERAGQR